MISTLLLYSTSETLKEVTLAWFELIVLIIIKVVEVKVSFVLLTLMAN